MTTNLLTNGTFDAEDRLVAAGQSADGAYKKFSPGTLSGLMPAGWDLDSYSKPGDPRLPKQDQDWGSPEIIPIKYRRQFPEDYLRFDKSDNFILKVFRGGTPVAAQFSQTVLADAGRYRLTVPMFPDHWHQMPDGSLVRPSAATSADYYLASEALVGLGNAAINWQDARAVPIGGYTALTVEAEHPGGFLKSTFALRGRWGFHNNGWFVDGVKLELIAPVITPPLPPPPPHAQGVTRADLDALDVFAANADASLAQLRTAIAVLKGKAK